MVSKCSQHLVLFNHPTRIIVFYGDGGVCCLKPLPTNEHQHSYDNEQVFDNSIMNKIAAVRFQLIRNGIEKEEKNHRDLLF